MNQIKKSISENENETLQLRAKFQTSKVSRLRFIMDEEVQYQNTIEVWNWKNLYHTGFIWSELVQNTLQYQTINVFEEQVSN